MNEQIFIVSKIPSADKDSGHSLLWGIETRVMLGCTHSPYTRFL